MLTFIIFNFNHWFPFLDFYRKGVYFLWYLIIYRTYLIKAIIKALFFIILFINAHGGLVYYFDYSLLYALIGTWSDDPYNLLMEGEPSSLGSNSGGGQSGGSNPNPGGGPSGGSDTLIPDNDSPEKRKRREMADYLEGLSKEVIENRSAHKPVVVNRRVYLPDLNIYFKKSVNSHLASDTEKYLMQYRIDNPDLFNKSPSLTIVSNIISHLRNNNN